MLNRIVTVNHYAKAMGWDRHWQGRIHSEQFDNFLYLKDDGIAAAREVKKSVKPAILKGVFNNHK
jgi:hypothetical protein